MNELDQTQAAIVLGVEPEVATRVLAVAASIGPLSNTRIAEVVMLIGPEGMLGPRFQTLAMIALAATQGYFAGNRVHKDAAGLRRIVLEQSAPGREDRPDMGPMVEGIRLRLVETESAASGDVPCGEGQE